MLSHYVKKQSIFSVIGLCLMFFGNANAEQVMPPTSISISQNAQVNIDLSNTDINKIFVNGQKITAITKPDNVFNSNNDASGNVYATISGNSPFTAFVSTDQGLHFSLLITPKSEPGQTIEFLPTGFSNKNSGNKAQKNAPIVHHSVVAAAFEQSSSYEKTLVNLIRDVMLQRIPPGYTAISSNAFSQISQFVVSSTVTAVSGLTEKVQAGFLGGALAVRVLSVKNASSKPVELLANQFYNPGVRAVAISQEYLQSGGKTFVFEVVSNV